MRKNSRREREQAVELLFWLRFRNPGRVVHREAHEPIGEPQFRGQYRLGTAGLAYRCYSGCL